MATPGVDVPILPSGYEWVAMPPDGMMPISSIIPDAVYGWDYVEWAHPEEGNCREYHDSLSNTTAWACQLVEQSTTTTPSVTREQVREIQRALLKAGYSPGVIDGLWGPNTCGAAYKFKREVLQDWGYPLNESFFWSLGLANRGYEEKFYDSCKNWHTDNGVVIEPEPAPENGFEAPPAPAAGSNWLRWLIVGVAGVSGALIGRVAGKRWAPRANRYLTMGTGGLAAGVSAIFLTRGMAPGMAGLGLLNVVEYTPPPPKLPRKQSVGQTCLSASAVGWAGAAPVARYQ